MWDQVSDENDYLLILKTPIDGGALKLCNVKLSTSDYQFINFLIATSFFGKDHYLAP